MSRVIHEVYGVKFGSNTHGTRGRYFMGDAALPADELMPLDYFVWAIRSDRGDIVLDAGWTADTNKGRPRTLIENPGDALRRLGVDPESVETVVLSHFHNDHVGDLDAFPQATFVAQRAEYEFWTSEVAWRPELARHAERDDIDRLVGLREHGRLELVDGDTEIVDGVDVVHVGGHTPGSQVVVVRTARGTVVLAADAAHFFENVELDRPFSVHTDLPDYYSALARLRELGDVAAGHDPALFTRFDAVAGLAGRAVRVA
jgi:glyoxylase-like metal-dependent hydrolase (beta-lactamase superfamily II)